MGSLIQHELGRNPEQHRPLRSQSHLLLRPQLQRILPTNRPSVDRSLLRVIQINRDAQVRPVHIADTPNPGNLEMPRPKIQCERKPRNAIRGYQKPSARELSEQSNNGQGPRSRGVPIPEPRWGSRYDNSPPSENASASRPSPTLLSGGQANKQLEFSDYVSSTARLSTHPDWEAKGRQADTTRTFRHRRG